MPEPIRLSVIMPVYNEEGAIVAAVDEVQQHVLDLMPGFRAGRRRRRIARRYRPPAR